MEFPQYRKYNNDRSYFKIDSGESFREIKLMVKSYSDENFKAKIHPDRIYIQDMLECANEAWLVIQENEFNQKVIEVEKSLKKL